MPTLGRNIRALRKREGLTQEMLAETVGVSRATVARWERGSIAQVRGHNLHVLCERFGVTEDDLASETLGLAAQAERKEQGAPALAPTSALLPLATIENDQVTLPKTPTVEVPLSIAAEHPRAFVLEATGRFSLVQGATAPQLGSPGMPDVLMRPLHVVVDPHFATRDGELLLVRAKGHGCFFARLHAGRAKTMVVPEGPGEDLLLPARDVESLGGVIWWQPTPLV